MYKEKLKDIMLGNNRTLPDLKTVKSLKLKNWYIAAGYVRNQVWDALHNITVPAIFHDVDVIYFDHTDTSEETDKNLEKQLKSLDPSVNWSVKNQARMHIRNQDAPYSDVADAMKRWPETATAVGITLTHQNEIEIVAPHGLQDLFDLLLRQSPYFKDRTLFERRIYEKGWLERWKKLKVI